MFSSCVRKRCPNLACAEALPELSVSSEASTTTSRLVSFSIIQQSTGGGERVVLEQGKFVFVL